MPLLKSAESEMFLPVYRFSVDVQPEYTHRTVPMFNCYGAGKSLAIFKARADPEPFVENSHAAGRPKTITNDDRNGLFIRESLVLGGQR